jgi:hypothetical protein
LAPAGLRQGSEVGVRGRREGAADEGTTREVAAAVRGREDVVGAVVGIRDPLNRDDLDAAEEVTGPQVSEGAPVQRRVPWSTRRIGLSVAMLPDIMES